MNTNDVLEQRRSIRKFKPGSITKDQIEELVHASQMAPSWKNSQTPRYYVATTEEGMNKMRAGLPQRNADHTINAVAMFVLTFKKDVAGFMKNGLTIVSLPVTFRINSLSKSMTDIPRSATSSRISSSTSCPDSI